MLKRQKGQGLVEFALVAPILLLIILAIIETALIFQGYLAVQHAAREAARWAVTYQPEKGKNVDGTVCCPNESDAEYWARRVELIKQVAVDSAVGLRINEARLGLTPSTFESYKTDPNFFGVQVWGQMSFDASDSAEATDKPGLPGLRVYVKVTHNVELIDPIFRSAVLQLFGMPSVQVSAHTEMVNEGVQVGCPGCDGSGSGGEGGGGPCCVDGVGWCCDPGGGQTPIVDFIEESFTVGETSGMATITVGLINAPDDEAINVNYFTTDDTATEGSDYTAVSGILTFDPGVNVKTFQVPIIDDTEEELDEVVILTLAGGNADIGPNSPAELIILDDDGSLPVVDFKWGSSNVDEDIGVTTIDVELDDPSGKVVTVDYATSDNTATAGDDYTAVNGTLTFDPGVTNQTFDVPIIDDMLKEDKENFLLNLENPTNAILGTSNNPAILNIRDDEPLGPFITASDYVVTPTKPIFIHVNQHDEGTYSLHWVDEGFNLKEVISTSLYVDASGNKHFIPFTIPADIVPGDYYVETHQGGMVARSDAIQVLPPQADLVVSDVSVPDEIEPGQGFTVTVAVRNQLDVAVTGDFDIDVYIDPEFEPTSGQPGSSKQWLVDIGPLETKVVTHIVTVDQGGSHELWAQVDTSNLIAESDEENNVYGPMDINVLSGECSELSDRFYGPELESKWISAKIGNASVHNMSIDEEEGTLSIEANGTSIWGSPDAGGTLLYQPVSGDFVATVKIIQAMEGTGQQWAKIGLMARDSTAANSRWVMVMKARDVVQFAYRTGSSGERFASDAAAGVPVWLRLVRTGDAFAGYYSLDGANWVAGTGDGENGGVNVDLGDSILIGVAAASYSSSPATGIVDDFEVCPMDADSETCQIYSDDFEVDSTIAWLDLDIGETLPGSSSKSGGTMTVYGDGASLWGSDNFHYTYQQVSGNFVATLKINAGPGQAEYSKAGLMVRGSTAQDSAQVMAVKTRDHGVQFGYREFDGGGSLNNFGANTEDGTLPVWVRIARNGNAFSAFYSTDGVSWAYGGSARAEVPDAVLVGMAVSSYSGDTVDSGNFDDFLFCAGEAGDIDPPPPPEPPPPGYQECTQVIELGDFEASQITPPWIRDVEAFHDHSEKHSGNFSLGFRATVGPRPALLPLHPWAYQAVTVPDSAIAETTGTLSYWQFIKPDPEQSPENDPDDHFYLTVRDAGGVTQTSSILLAQGDDVTPVFQRRVISIETHLPGNGFADFAGQDIQVKFFGTHDSTEPGTIFYIDDVRLDICTTQPVPPDEPGTASIGGLILALAGTPTPVPGTRVWAYAAGGELYETKTIHDSTYHFYNVPPGTYTIYAEVWYNGVLYTGTTEVTVAANERNYGVDLTLQ